MILILEGKEYMVMLKEKLKEIKQAQNLQLSADFTQISV